MLSDKKNLDAMSKAAREHTTTYGSRYFTKTVPKYEMPEDGMPARAAYQIIHDELNLDGNPCIESSQVLLQPGWNPKQTCLSWKTLEKTTLTTMNTLRQR